MTVFRPDLKRKFRVSRGAESPATLPLSCAEMAGPRRGFLLLAPLASVALLAAGCGGGGSSSTSGTQPTTTPQTTTRAAQSPHSARSTSRPSAPIVSTERTTFTDYELAMQLLGSKLAHTLTQTDRSISVSSTQPDLVVHDLRTAQKQLRSAAASLEKITPPARIRTLHEQLIHGVQEYATELDAMIAHVEKGGGASISTVLPTLKGVKDMRAASDAITKKGYVIVVDNGP